MKNIILIAPPAAGKGTQAALISEKYNIPHISIGNLVRKSISDQKLLDQLNKGLLLDDKIVCDIVKKRISLEDCKNGFILDGFPRNLNQAKMYENIVSEINIDGGIVIVIDIDKAEGIRRIEGRLICGNCGAVYNETEPTTIPKINGKCDICGSKLEKRYDDNFETFNKRFDTYVKDTVPVIKYYQKTKKVHFVKSINISKTSNDIDLIIRSEV